MSRSWKNDPELEKAAQFFIENRHFFYSGNIQPLRMEEMRFFLRRYDANQVSLQLKKMETKEIPITRESLFLELRKAYRHEPKPDIPSQKDKHQLSLLPQPNFNYRVYSGPNHLFLEDMDAQKIYAQEKGK